ncbi:MAG: alpha/beta fold hydrolase [Bryobacteraceae bacterium]
MFLALALLLAAILFLAIRQSESILHVWPRRRLVVRTEAADEIGTHWEPAETKSRDGLTLRGWLFYPSQWNGKAAVALHGFADSRMGMLPHASLLVKNGFAALLPDSRGHGVSDGNLVTFGLREAADVSAWGDYLKSRLGVDRFYAIGNSMGAGVLLTALSTESRIAAAIIECGYTSFADVAKDKLARRLHLPAWSARTLLFPVALTAFAYARLRYGVAMWRVRPLDHARDACVPMLLIHGTADEDIPHRHSRELHRANPRWAGLWEVEGMGHVEAASAVAGEYERRLLAQFDVTPRVPLGPVLVSPRLPAVRG